MCASLVYQLRNFAFPYYNIFPQQMQCLFPIILLKGVKKGVKKAVK